MSNITTPERIRELFEHFKTLEPVQREYLVNFFEDAIEKHGEHPEVKSFLYKVRDLLVIASQ